MTLVACWHCGAHTSPGWKCWRCLKQPVGEISEEGARRSRRGEPAPPPAAAPKAPKRKRPAARAGEPTLAEARELAAHLWSGGSVLDEDGTKEIWRSSGGGVACIGEGATWLDAFAAAARKTGIKL